MPNEIVVPRFVRGLIFDCDGTLADTMGLHWQAWVEAFAANGEMVATDVRPHITAEDDTHA